ncbi:recombinase family protein, partial [Promicromonospora kroppenstedtii]|uniref:recombinase family protein n=1 Tax=Promicromonospora kroppenstedtii TaxID=440482 RepID=UPI00146FBCFA
MTPSPARPSRQRSYEVSSQHDRPRLYADLIRLPSLRLDRQATRAARPPLPDAVVYEERSVSGAKVPFADRDEGARLLAALQPGDRVLATKIDRVARNVRDLLDLVERIEREGASIVFVDQSIDT